VDEQAGMAMLHMCSRQKRYAKTMRPPHFKLLSAVSMLLGGAELRLAADIALFTFGDDTFGLAFALLPELPDL